MKRGARDEEGAREAPPPSKSQAKREHLALLTLARELADCPDRMLARFGLTDRIIEGLVLARRLQKGALQRQLRHLGGLLAEADPHAIRAALMAARAPDLAAVRRFKRVEGWRDALLAGDDNPLKEILQACPDADPGQLAKLVRQAREAQDPRAARALFRYLRSLEATAGEHRVDL